MPKCVIKVLDEVNIKLDGLDLDTRKALVKKFKLIDPAAKYTPAVRLGRWDGAVQYFSISGGSYLFLLPSIIEHISRITAHLNPGYEYEIEDQRDAINLQFEPITTEYWGDLCWPAKHRFAGQPIRLRDDQVEAVNIFLENPQGIQELATGFGKTILTATLCKICEKYGRTITIVPNRSLIEQTLEDYANCGLDVGVYYGSRKELDKTHTICTWQSLEVLEREIVNEGGSERYAALLDGVKTVIVDECHMASASVMKKLLTQRFARTAIRWGITGTIPRAAIDAQNLYVSLGDILGKVKASDLQEQGVLSNCHVNIIQTVEWLTFRDYHHEYTYLVTDTDRLDLIAQKSVEIAKTGNTLVLVDRIESGNYLADAISALVGTPCPFVSGTTKSKTRQEEYSSVNDTDGKILVATFGVCAVGLNLPRLFNVILVEPGKSFVKVIQSIGRGLRKAKDKDFVNIYDITATTKYAKRHLTERKLFYKDANYPFSVEKVVRKTS